MDLATIGTAAASAPAGVLVYKLAEKIIEKFPWQKLPFFSKNGKKKKFEIPDGAQLTKDQAQLMILEHKEGCLNILRIEINGLRSSVSEMMGKYSKTQEFITQWLIDNANR